MKIEQLIVQHLYNSKSVTLQGIGTIHLDPAVVLPAEGDKEATIPEHAFSFEYDLKAGEDAALIDFIVQQTRKIKPLASSDLESYAMLAKQFLNIGKPLSIEGVGTILKSQSGLYEFKQGQFVAPKIGDVSKEVREKDKTEETISFESQAPGAGNNRKILIIAFILAFAVLAGLGLYYFIFKKKGPGTETTEQVTAQQQDTANNRDTVTPTADTIAVTPVADSSVSVKPPVVSTDSFSFRIVLKEYPNEVLANKAFSKLSSYGHKLEVIRADSVRFQLAMPFKTAITDTLRAKDSIRRFFGGRPYILIK